MNFLEMGRIAFECERRLGLRLRMETDLEKIPAVLDELGKGFLSPVLDPAQNDFTPANCFWLIAEDSSGPVLAGGVRLDDLSSWDVKRYWARMLERVFDQQPKPLEVPFPAELIHGRVAYFGDLFSSSEMGLGRRGAERIRLFTLVGHYLTQNAFSSPPDVTYCFMQEKDVLRGAAPTYGFLDLCPFLYNWSSPPYPAGCPEWIASLPKSKVPQLMASMERFIAQ